MQDKNIEMVEAVAQGLGALSGSVVFVGGAITALYAPQSFAEDIRPTEDVDVVIKVASYVGYHSFEEELRKSGFKNDKSPGAPLCRWQYKSIKVDIMPVKTPPFSDSVINGVNIILPSGTSISIFPPALYVCSKLEAVLSRGLSDIRLSHDFEDVIFIIDNCAAIQDEVKQSSDNVKRYIKKVFGDLSKIDCYQEAVECALPLNAADRAALVIEKINNWINNL